jgi:LPS O-antigen subunit length determinant protein (WzzB/FepE family)
MRDIFYLIVQEQQKNNMLAQATPEYVFKTISKAMIPSEKSRPVRSQIIVLFSLLGFLISTLITYIYQYNGYEFDKYLPKKIN